VFCIYPSCSPSTHGGDGAPGGLRTETELTMNHSTLLSADRAHTCSRVAGPVAPRALRHAATLASLAALTAGVFLWSKPAAAESTLGVDLNFNDANDLADTQGAGVDVYFGPRMDLKVLDLTTEISLGFHDFGGEVDPAVYRAMAGGRLAIPFVIRPSVFAHLGVGHLRFNDPLGSDDRDSRTNLAADLGAALDLSITPAVDLGVHVSYNVVAGDDDYTAFDWMQAGAHVVFVFGG